ncbi:hypothetical protein TGAM01_v201680 [Trichoderma gamsii]|uniref:DUF427 domain-containing protein n=1 Tax=Trichoderma gamsii TaxID=398673 RepID=A0A2P4ZYU8_9HYPO|nr:hypothetical protein TGAM01_v201680 [Trichoderma gamsii]PON29431.1 hypothetical protein TGAM01_v201680 [Trichoderma gamsii]
MGKSVISKSGLATARVNGTVIAEANSWWETEGNIYFPPESIKGEYFTGTSQHSYCPWKGDASYYTINAGDNAAWYYPQPLEGAVDLRDHVAFYKNKVEISAN